MPGSATTMPDDVGRSVFDDYFDAIRDFNNASVGLIGFTMLREEVDDVESRVGERQARQRIEAVGGRLVALGVVSSSTIAAMLDDPGQSRLVNEAIASLTEALVTAGIDVVRGRHTLDTADAFATVAADTSGLARLGVTDFTGTIGDVFARSLDATRDQVDAMGATAGAPR
jgi:hypothetical protein